MLTSPRPEGMQGKGEGVKDKMFLAVTKQIQGGGEGKSVTIL